MNIVLLTGKYPPYSTGGGEISTSIIAAGLAKLGHTISVICDGDQPLYEEKEGIHIARLPLSFTSKPLFEKAKAKHIAHTIGTHEFIKTADIVHAHDFRSALVLSELIAMNYVQKNRAYITVRDYAQISGDTNMILSDGTIPSHPTSWTVLWKSQRVKEASPIRKLFRFWQYAYNIQYRLDAFRSIPNHVYISRSQVELIRKHQDLSHVRTTVIYNPLHQSYIDKPTQKGVNGNVLYIGRVEMYKGVGLLIDAWKNIVSAHPHVHLTIVGEGAQMRLYELRIASLGLAYSISLKHHLQNDRMIRIYDASDIVVSPHLWNEPFGRTVIEAMARGKIVVASNVGGPAEIIQHRKTGLLFDRRSSQDCAKKIGDALTMRDGERKTMQSEARNWVITNCNADTIAKEYQKYYENV